jgi:hypothetical protein
MKTQTASTVVGVFENHSHANRAITALHSAGFGRDQIGLAIQHAHGVTGDGVAENDRHAGWRALTGALTGLGLGALAGFGVLAGVIPVVGPAIASGTLGVILSNAAAGSGIAGLIGGLVGAGTPEPEAKFYQGELAAGRAIVTVNAGTRSAEVTQKLRQYGAYVEASFEKLRLPTIVP